MLSLLRSGVVHSSVVTLVIHGDSIIYMSKVKEGGITELAVFYEIISIKLQEIFNN
jgi:hypothetical protein